MEDFFASKILFIPRWINLKLMQNSYKKNAKLILSNGIVFPTFFWSFGTAVGEIVFNTE